MIDAQVAVPAPETATFVCWAGADVAIKRLAASKSILLAEKVCGFGIMFVLESVHKTVDGCDLEC
jgi:hypothetical protein